MLRVESSPFAAPNHNSTQLCWLTCGLLQPCISTQRYAFQEYEHRRTIRAHTRCTHTANALARLTFPARLARLARLTWTGNTPLPVRARQARRAGETFVGVFISAKYGSSVCCVWARAELQGAVLGLQRAKTGPKTHFLAHARTM